MNQTPQNPTVLLSAADVLSPKHVPSFLLLTLSTGAVNAGAFAVCERFVTHVTGTATRIGADAGDWFLMLEYLMVLVAFIVGAMTSVFAIQARALRGKSPIYAAPILGAAAILLIIASVGRAGLLGPVGGLPPEQPADFAFMSILAFAMGLLNAGVASSTALAVRTTHMTGPASDFGVSLGTALVSEGEARTTALQIAGLRGGKLLTFILGAAIMFPLVGSIGFIAFAVPAVVLAWCAVRSFALPKILTHTNLNRPSISSS